MIDEYIKEGKIVPVEITLALLRKAMEKETKAKGFLIDGFLLFDNDMIASMN